jgi:hypothetical protein
LPNRFTDILRAAGKAPLTDLRRFAAADHEDGGVLQNDHAYAHERTGRVFSGFFHTHSYLPKFCVK